MWRSYNLGRWIARLRVEHLLSDYGWLTYPNSPVAPIKSYSGCRGYALVLIVSESPLWRAQLEMSVIKNSVLLPLAGNRGRWVLYTRLLTPPERSWGGGGVEHSHFLPFLRLSLHNSAYWSDWRACEVFTLVSVSQSCLLEGCIHQLYNISVSSPVWDFSWQSWVKLEGMQMGCDVLWTAPALCVTLTSHILSSCHPWTLPQFSRVFRSLNNAGSQKMSSLSLVSLPKSDNRKFSETNSAHRCAWFLP